MRVPFDALGGHTIRRASATLLNSLRKGVLTHGLYLLQPALHIVLVPDPKLLDREALQLLAEAAKRGVIAAALGRGVPAQPAPGVRGTSDLASELDGEWAAIALSPSTCAGILARRVPGTESQFDFGVTHDRRRVVAVARCLLRHLGPLPGADEAGA